MTTRRITSEGGSGSPPTISVVVCAYTFERLEQLRGALSSVLDQSQPPTELIVVIDHNEELFEVVARETAPTSHTTVTVLPNTRRRGLSGARNTGVEAAAGDIVAFLDDDALADERWLEHLVAPMRDDTRVAGTGGTALPVWAEGARPTWFPDEFAWTVGCTYTGAAPDGADIRNPLGCSMAFRRDALRQIGGFNAEVGRVGKHPLGCEETELCVRIRQEWPHLGIRHCAAAIIHHHVSADRHRFRYFRRRCFAEGLSKAIVTRTVGSADGLSSERDYVRRVLPRAVASGLAETARTRRGAGALRAGAVVVGLTWTSAGFVRGRLSPSRKGTQP